MASSVDAKLLRATKFPPEFNQKVDMQKVNLQVMKKWIASKISEILGSEDDVVTELCFNLIEGSRYPDIKSMQIQLTGFLDKDTAPFCKDLWNLCLSAQSSPQGVPKELLEAKKLELIQEKTRLLKNHESDVRPRSVVTVSYQTYEIESGATVAFVAGGAIIGVVGDVVVAIEPLAVVAVEALAEAVTDRPHHHVESGTHIITTEIVTYPQAVVGVGRRPDVDAPYPAPRVPSPEALCLVPDHRARLADVAGELVTDHLPHLVAVLGGVDRHLAIELQGSEIGLQGEQEVIGPAETVVEETHLRRRSRSPPRRDSRRLSRSRSSSYSRSRSRSPRRRPVRELISRSPSPSHRGRLRRTLTRSPSKSESDEETRRPRRRSPQRNGQDSKARDIPSRRRRDSADSPRTRNRSADVSEDEDKSRSPRHRAASTADETKSPVQQANELREKLLKERIKKMRGTSSRDNVKGSG
ncbi:hypothetical protein F5Y00DRAFT_259457 [Daldinia vernicosa]|uniref:uncharacterized protein n=1 Tax=Daldinia vernicosa TaxID=114800 RepID=UPI002007BCA0|nr:uncharacterized protein F5Y00DRAFT_259457 [Daldinia vernicosa]KAI0851448.1 hypothetical protein F5Y00DRAFT_259457 [Daldinia vernicosa]